MLGPDGFEVGRQDIDGLEPDPAVPGCIPGNVPEGRQHQDRQARLTGQVFRTVQQGRAQPLAGEGRQDIELLEVEAAIKGAEPEGGDGLFSVEDSDPQPARLQPGFQEGLRRGRILRDPGLRRPQEPLRRLVLYGAYGGKFRPQGRPDPMGRRLGKA